MAARAIMTVVLQFLRLRLRSYCLAVVRVFGEDRPNDLRSFIRHSNCYDKNGFVVSKRRD
jgi:hypothetical protein